MQPIVTLAGRSVLFAMAAEAEYGPHLQALFTPLMTGVGPVEAGISLTHALADLRAAGSPPDLVVSLGSAGSRTLEQAEVYQATSVSYRDMDASPTSFEDLTFQPWPSSASSPPSSGTASPPPG